MLNTGPFNSKITSNYFFELLWLHWCSATDWMDLSLDDKSANKMLWVSDGGSRVCRRTEEVCPVLDRPERYEYSPQASRTTNTLLGLMHSVHEAFTVRLSPLILSVKGGVQGGYLEHEGLLGGGVQRLGGDRRHLWRSWSQGQRRAQRPGGEWGVLGSVLVGDVLPDLVQRRKQGHRQRPSLLHHRGLPGPAGRDHHFLRSDRWRSGAGGGAAAHGQNGPRQKDSSRFLDGDSVLVHNIEKTRVTEGKTV